MISPNSVRGDVAAVEKILGQDRHMINIVSRDGDSPLHLASQFPPAVVALVRCPQSDLNIADSHGRTVLHWAASRLEPGLLRLLVEAGADVSCQDLLGNTPAHLLWTEDSAMANNTANLYSNTMEDLLEPSLTNLVQTVTSSQVEQVQLGLLLFLFKQGATNLANYRNDTVTDLIESQEIRRFVEDTFLRDGEASDHEYAEIAEDALEAEDAQEKVEPSAPAECRVCNELVMLVTFLPCMHKVRLYIVQYPHSSHSKPQVACFNCCKKMKKCLECGVRIEHRIIDVNDQSPAKSREEGSEEDERSLCNICLERRKDTAFLCGHQACSICAEELPNNLCHICRKPIERKIPLFNS